VIAEMSQQPRKAATSRLLQWGRDHVIAEMSDLLGFNQGESRRFNGAAIT
jgi:hypothetical protein